MRDGPDTPPTASTARTHADTHTPPKATHARHPILLVKSQHGRCGAGETAQGHTPWIASAFFGDAASPHCLYAISKPATLSITEPSTGDVDRGAAADMRKRRAVRARKNIHPTRSYV